MTKSELIQMLQTDVDVRSAVTELLKESIVGMMESDIELRAAVITIVKEDMSFDLSCSDYHDYDYSGYRIALCLDGSEVAADSFTVKTS